MRIPFISLLIFLLATSPVRAQDKPRPAADVTDRIIEPFMKQQHVPGLVLAIVRHDEVIVEKGYGVRSVEDHHMPDADTLFYVGSISKAMTAAGIELLAERGKVKLDAPIGDYVKSLPTTWQPIPLKFFLAHQTGIPEITSATSPVFAEEVRDFDQIPLQFQPGIKQAYNNLGYVVAGQVIEAVSGKPYLDFMTENVFKPLGMIRTGCRQTDPNFSPGHFLRDGKKYDVVTEALPKGGEYGIPSGYVQSTLADLLRFYRGIQQHKLLPPARTNEMLCPVTTGMSATCGWFTRKVNGVTVIAKEGTVAGYTTEIEFAPASDDAVIFIMNLQGDHLDTARLANTLLREVCDMAVEKDPVQFDQ